MAKDNNFTVQKKISGLLTALCCAPRTVMADLTIVDSNDKSYVVDPEGVALAPPVRAVAVLSSRLTVFFVRLR